MILEPIICYKSSWRILELLYDAPLKEIARKDIRLHAKIGMQAINGALSRLEKTGIIIKNKIGKKERYYLNTANPAAQTIIEMIREERLRLKNISFEHISTLSEFIRKTLDNTSGIKEIYLFGSAAKGTARLNSDIDIAIITTNADVKEEIKITSITHEIESQYHKKIQTHFFTQKEYNNSKTQLIKEIKRDGIKTL